MSNESFEEWLDKYGEGGIHLEGLSPKEYGRSVWATLTDHQQEKIQELEKTIEIRENRIEDSRKLIIVQREQNEELKKLLGEAIKEIKGSCQYDESWIDQNELKANYCEGDPDLERYKIFRSFLSKPEIRKYLPEGGV